MATKTRLYRVCTPNRTRLVEASTVQRAIAHVARDEIKADIPQQHEIFNMAKAGIEIEKAGDVEQISDETRAAASQSVIE